MEFWAAYGWEELSLAEARAWLDGGLDGPNGNFVFEVSKSGKYYLITDSRDGECVMVLPI